MNEQPTHAGHRDSSIGLGVALLWTVRQFRRLPPARDLVELRTEGKHAALMRLKSGDTTKFVALPLSHA
jgi:hypothetical protein